MFLFHVLFRTQPQIQVFEIPFVGSDSNDAYKLPQPPINQAIIGLSPRQKIIVCKEFEPLRTYSGDPLIQTIKRAHLYHLINEFHRMNRRHNWMHYAGDVCMLITLLNVFRLLTWGFFRLIGP